MFFSQSNSKFSINKINSESFIFFIFLESSKMHNWCSLFLLQEDITDPHWQKDPPSLHIIQLLQEKHITSYSPAVVQIHQVLVYSFILKKEKILIWDYIYIPNNKAW